MDVLNQGQRARSMRSNKSRDTTIEIILRKALWHCGYRYRKNYKGLPGTPDIVLMKYKIAIFCDSEFWHGYHWDKKRTRIKANRDFWIQKIDRNIERDNEVNRRLEAMGWIVLRFWGADISRRTTECIEVVEDAILESLIQSDIK